MTAGTGLTAGVVREDWGPMPDNRQRRPHALQTRYLFSAAMNVQADKDRIFNEVYDQSTWPSLLKVRVSSRSPLQSEPVTMMIGVSADHRDRGEPTYNALYEIESPAVLTSDAWAKLSRKDDWPSQSGPTPRTGGT